MTALWLFVFATVFVGLSALPNSMRITGTRPGNALPGLQLRVTSLAAFYAYRGNEKELMQVDSKNFKIKEFNSRTINAHSAILRHKLNMMWTYNSLALEGNSLSFGDTIFFLQEGLTVQGKPLKDYLEAKGHFDAIASMEDCISGARALSNSLLCEMNYLLTGHMKHTKAIDTSGHHIEVPFTSGQFRTHPIHVRTRDGTIHQYVEAWQIPAEMHDLIEYCNEPSETLHPVVRAAVAHYNMVRIHPFQDGNGRGARLLMNLLLLKGGLPPAVVQVAERDKYLAALRTADVGDIQPFVEFITSSTVKTLDVVLDTIEKELKVQ